MKMCLTLVVAGVALGLAALPALSQEKAAAGDVKEGSLKGKTLTFVSYGGIYQDGQIAALKEFVDKSGVQLLSDGPTEIAKLQAQVESGNVTWDVLDTSDFPPYVYCGKLFQKPDMSKIDTSKIPAGQGSECSAPAMNYGVGLMYTTDTSKHNPPTSSAALSHTHQFPCRPALVAPRASSTYPAALMRMAAPLCPRPGGAAAVPPPCRVRVLAAPDVSTHTPANPDSDGRRSSPAAATWVRGR